MPATLRCVGDYNSRRMTTPQPRNGSAELTKLLKDLPKFVRAERQLAKDAQLLIRVGWGDSLDLLAGLLHACRELGREFLSAEYDAAKESNDLVFFALMHLHASGCLVASEILSLLESGYGSGANARWRSLHEVAAYSMFIKKHGQQTAERYLRHSHIKDWEDMPAVDGLLKASGGEGFIQEEREMLERLKAQLLITYGLDFSGGHGWAKGAYPTKGRLGFKDIAEDVGLGSLESFYRAASHVVHPTWNGVQDNDGLPSELANGALLAGPSEHGLWTPAMLTTRSLYAVTLSFVLCRDPNPAWLAKLSTLSELVEYVTDALRDARDATLGPCNP